MLLPCPSCKKPVFVSGSTLSSGAVDVQCSNCGAALKVYPDGSSELLNVGPPPGPLPPPTPPPPPAPAEELNETNTQWHEPAAAVSPTPLEMPVQPPSDPRVESLSTVAAKRSEQELMQEPPADWPVARAETPPPQPPAMPPAETPPPQPPAMPPAALAEMKEVVVPPAPPPASVESLKGTDVIEINPSGTPGVQAVSVPPPIHTPPAPPIEPPPSPVDEHGRPLYMKNAAPIYPEALERLVPEVVLSTVEITDPRWHEENHEKHRETMKIDRDTQKAARAAISATAPSGDDEPAPPPIEPPPAVSPPERDAAESLQSDAVPEEFLPPLDEPPGLAPAFSAAPITTPPPPATPSHAPVVESPAPEPVLSSSAQSMGFDSNELENDDDELEEFSRSRGSPVRALAIAAVLILLVGAGLVFFGDDGDVSAGEPMAARAPAPENPAKSGAEASEEQDPVDSTEGASDQPSGAELDGADRNDKRPKKTESRRRGLAQSPTPAATPNETEVKTLESRTPAQRVNGSSRDRVRAEQLYVQANRYLQERKYQLAISNLKDCIRLDPRHGGAYRSLGVSYMTLGQERAAIEAYKRFVQILPSHKDAPAVRQIIADYGAR